MQKNKLHIEIVQGFRLFLTANEVIKLRDFVSDHEAVLCGDREREVAGLTDLVRLFRHHPEAVAGDLKPVMAAIVKQMKNLRSQVLRAAVQTSAEMFQHCGKAAEAVSTL